MRAGTLFLANLFKPTGANTYSAVNVDSAAQNLNMVSMVRSMDGWATSQILLNLNVSCPATTEGPTAPVLVGSDLYVLCFHTPGSPADNLDAIVTNQIVRFPNVMVSRAWPPARAVCIYIHIHTDGEMHSHTASHIN